ncbi:hypothetical protein HCU40_16690 [Pseudanabaena biceps]|nr:hypothetical protein [Pseudanabaena biceps]
MTSHFDFHYARYKQAGEKMSQDCEPKDFKRWHDIREAARTAIALEAGIIDTIPNDGIIRGSALYKFILLVRRYELGDIAA